MRLGLLARGDNSGIANQTEEVFRHLRPAKTLIVDLGPHNRGPFRPHRFVDPEHCETRVTFSPTPMDDEIRWLCDQIDVLYIVETNTHSGLNRHCMETGARLIVHANPELYDANYGEPPAELWAATSWRLDLLPGTTRIVPHPVATDRFCAREVTKVERVLHVPAQAMLDRNGTELVDKARPRLRESFTVDVPPQVDNYWDLYHGADALVIPRRYAGLCLTMQEAAAAGLPIVMLDTDPNAYRTLPELRIPVTEATSHRMKGGMVDVWDADPYRVAEVIDRLADPEIVARASAASRAWAQEIAWTALLPVWQRLLRLEDVGAGEGV